MNKLRIKNVALKNIDGKITMVNALDTYMDLEDIRERMKFSIDKMIKNKNNMENKLEKAFEEYNAFYDSGYVENEPNSYCWDLSNPKHPIIRKFTIEEFEFRILTNTKFRKKFGKDCIRGLSIEERKKLFLEIYPTWPAVPTHKFFDEQNIPKYVII